MSTAHSQVVLPVAPRGLAELRGAPPPPTSALMVLRAGARASAFLQAPPPAPRTKRTRRVPHPVLIALAASVTPY